jgi:hypothetical protein
VATVPEQCPSYDEKTATGVPRSEALTGVRLFRIDKTSLDYSHFFCEYHRSLEQKQSVDREQALG